MARVDRGGRTLAIEYDRPASTIRTTQPDGTEVVDRYDLAGREHSRSEVVARLVDAIGRQLTRLGRNPAQIGAQAHAACLQIDNWLTADTGFRRLSGRCLGIADDGALRLATSSQVELVYAGCLVHDTPATSPPAD